MMEISETQQDRQQLLTEKRKWQTEIENKRRQLEDDRRELQHLKSKALRERWLLDGAPPAGVQQDEARTRSLEDTINRLEEELLSLETGGQCETRTHTAVSSGSVTAAEVKVHSSRQLDRAAAAHVEPEVKVHKPRGAPDGMKRAMYSVEIKVERDKLTGETRVLSTNTTLPVDLSHQGVKVYEDERKVVHEMNGEDGVQLLSFSEVEELIHKADEASMMSQTIATVTSLPSVEVQEEVVPGSLAEITGLEAKAGGEPCMAEASADQPVTMVFMGYQSVEDEDETRRVLGLQGTVKAELVLIEDANGKTSPQAQTLAPPLPASPALPPATKAPEEKRAASNGETAGESAGESAGEVSQVMGGAVEVKKLKQPCKCCSIM